MTSDARPLALDHVIVFCDAGAPEAGALVRAGLVEGPPNTHPGQGTANRRFFFEQAYLELVWVHDAAMASSPAVRPTGLWDRWSARRSGGCPFGLVVRHDGAAALPFDVWPYRPAYLEGEAILVAVDTRADEPAIFALPGARTGRRPRPAEHPLGVRALTSVVIEGVDPERLSPAPQALAEGRLVRFAGGGPLLRLGFDDRTRGETRDRRPDLPLVLEW